MTMNDDITGSSVTTRFQGKEQRWEMENVDLTVSYTSSSSELHISDIQVYIA